MKKNVKNLFYIALLSGLGVILMYCINHSFFGISEIDDHNEALSDLLIQLEDKSCPFSTYKPPLGSLSWENDSSFLEICGKHGATLRLSAFQITMIDPLPGEKHNVALAADLLAGTVVGPGVYFSLNNSIGPYTSERGFEEGLIYSGENLVTAVGGGVCKIATTLYNAALFANLRILERYPHSMLVPYVLPGQDATVAYGARDLSFENNSDDPLVIWSDTRGNTLTIAIYGAKSPSKVTLHHELLSWQKRHTVYRNNSNLLPGEEKIIVKGADSVTVKSWLTIEDPDGTVATKDLGIDRYNPMPKVIEKAL